jgi:hypothetical protein
MKIVLTLLMACCMLKGHSQEQQKFVEVIVQDSMQIEPEEIFYAVVLSHQQFSTDTIMEWPKTIEKTSISKNESPADMLNQLILSMGIDTLPAPEFNVQMRGYFPFDKAVLLHFMSKQKLILFLKKAQEIEGLSGSIHSLKNSQTEIYKQQLTKKLLNQAKKDAEFVAEQCGKKLGNLLQVKEEKVDEPIGGWTMYPPLSALYEANLASGNDKIIIKKKLVVKYAW